MTVLIEFFSGEPVCGECEICLNFVDEIAKEYGDKVQVEKYIGPSAKDKFEEYHIELTPAIVINETYFIIGLTPSRETIKKAIDTELEWE
ncbi:MAG: thioredoxin family protein [Promethearchaeota archaeon]|jgi:predicted DsbA family dithiol-disulfide isomerase